jgi:predicted O-methyltransferase YrrM
MDRAIEQVLAEYDERADKERDMFSAPGANMMRTRDQMLLRVGPEAGQLINTLAKGIGAKSILELGTSYGYSTVWLAEAARATGGKVISLDLVADKQTYAKGMLGKCGLADHAEFISGDAIDILKRLNGPFDFVLVDLWKDLYVACFDLLYAGRLKPGALLVADNMIQPAAAREDANAYRRRVRASKDMESILLRLGQGLEISRYAPGETL